MKIRGRLTGLVLVLLALIAPWLASPQGGPSPSVLPWQFSLACTGLLLGVLPVSVPGWRTRGWWALLAGGATFFICVRGQSMEALAAVLAIFIILTCTVLATCRETRSDFVAVLAAAWLLAALTGSAIGLCQYFGLAQHFEPWISPSAMGEAFANLRQRNQFATLTNIGLAALLWCVAQSRVHQPQRVLARAGMLAAAVLLAAGNAASSSRTGLVQLVLLGGLVWMWGGLRWQETRRLMTVAMAAYAIATVVLPALLGLNPSEHGMWGRLSSGESACSSRITLWSNVLHLISQRPWLGWGWGELDYAHFITLYSGPRFCEILDNAHNLPLHLAVELGIPAALAICGGAGWLIFRAQPWRETDPTRQMAWGVLAVILLHSMLEYPLWYGPFQMAFGLCLGLLGSPSRNPTTDSNENLSVVLAVRGVLAAVLTTAIAYAAWDYHRISQIYRPPEARDAAYRDDTLAKIRDSWLFRNQVRFAELSITPLTRDNAQWTFNMATAQLHYSPEPRVIEKVIESAVLLGRDDEALAHLARYRAAFPADHARWAQANARASDERLQPLR